MLTREQYLLTKLAEEAAEIAQMALKTQQFGLNEVRAGQDLTNKQRLIGELNDLFAIVEILNDEYDLGFKPDYDATMKKIEKIKKYYALSQDLGKVMRP